MAFRREVFDFVGCFDERLDVGAAGCSGDSEFWYRILAQGRECLYEPTAVASHSHRREFDEFDDQIFHFMRGHVAALLIQFERYRHWGNLRRLFLSLPKYYVKSYLRSCFRRDYTRYQTLSTEVRGCLSGLTYYLRTRSARPRLLN